MILSAIAFYAFAVVLIACAALVISLRNPVHSVLFLILGFFSAAGLFVLVGAEFLAMILVIVYVGAVAVLFLFVVMMMDINFVQMRQGFTDYLPVGALVGIVLLAELLLVVGVLVSAPDGALAAGPAVPTLGTENNTQAIGEVLYTRYLYLFQAAGMVLLVAMIGAIVLTHRARPGVRRQRIADQVGRTRASGVELKKVTPGGGIS